MISDVYFPRINGVSTSIETFRHALAEHDIDIHLVAPTYPGGAEDQHDISRIPSRRVPFDPEDRLMNRGDLGRTLQSLGEQRFDLVHVQTPFAAHYAGLEFSRAQGIPCAATYHTHFEEYLHNYVPAVPRSWLRRLARTLARRQCNALDAVIVPSNAMRETLDGYGVSAPMHQVPTGIPVEHFRRPASTDFYRQFRQRHGIGPDHKVALFVGRAAHEKNIGFLIESLRHALHASPQLMLVIAGEGPALPALRRQAATLGLESHVRFVGYLDRHSELPACYAAADLFVFASKTETQGLVLLEAMAAGLPVLAFSCLGTKEIVEPRRGALPAPTNQKDFGQAMAALANDPARRAQMAKAGQAFVEEWSTDACARRLAAVYREIGQRHASRQS